MSYATVLCPLKLGQWIVNVTQVNGIDYLSGMDLDVNAILTKYGELITNEAKADIRNKSVTQYGSVNASGDLDKSIR